MEHVKCDLCGANDYTVLWNKANRAVAAIGVYDEQGNAVNGRVVVCRRCGLAYTNPRMTKAEYDDFYANRYRRIYRDSPEGEIAHAEYVCAEIGRRGLKPKRFLDVGCAGGELVRLMSRDCEAYGVDPRGSGENVTACDFEDYRTDMRFDLITCLNTLEHVLSPKVFLRKMRGLLTEEGKVLVGVPHLLTQTVNVSVDAFLSAAHLYHFTLETLKCCFRQCGLRPLDAWGHIEEIGDKLYMLGERDEYQRVLPTVAKDYAAKVKEHLRNADKFLELKRLGFR